jgi:UDP-N-acetylmuramyl tripeptide synthase
MPDGLVAALIERRWAPLAALEVDEGYLGQVSGAVGPEVVVLLNLSRDQLDRVGEVGGVAAGVRAALGRTPGSIVVANADDPMVVAAVPEAARAVWVSGGTGWTRDAAACPRCGHAIGYAEGDWWCSCGLRRPRSRWIVGGAAVLAPDGTATSLPVCLPGRMNRVNAAMAVVAAVAVGVPRVAAARAVGAVTDVAGRYRTVSVRGREVRLLLAKNPSGWAETLCLLDRPGRGVVIAVDGRQADGRDLSWLWDVPFERLRGRGVVATGGRAADLAVRLAYAEVEYELVPDLWRALEAAPAGAVDLVATYSVFQRLRRRLAGAR